MTSTRKKGGAKGPPTISRAGYLAALVEVQASGAVYADDIVNRLHRDTAGEALAAVNQLCHMHPPAQVLLHTIQQAGRSKHMKLLRDTLQHNVEHAKKQAEEVRRFMDGPAKGYSEQLNFSLEGLLEYWEIQARGYKVGIDMNGFPRKIEVDNAGVAFALRGLRDSLFPKQRAPREPIRLLIQVALGTPVSDDLAREALRGSNSLQTHMQKAGYDVGLSGVNKEKTAGLE